MYEEDIKDGQYREYCKETDEAWEIIMSRETKTNHEIIMANENYRAIVNLYTKEK